MDLIYLISTFIAENIGIIVGILVILAGMVSSRKKAKRAAEQDGSYEYNEPRDYDYNETDEEKRPPRSFKDLMAEIEAELSEETERKPWEIPAEPKPVEKPMRPKVQVPLSPEGSSAYPAREAGKASVRPTVKPAAAPPSVDIPGDLTAADLTKEKTSAAKKLVKRNELVTAVIMSEVLGKPKGLQD